MMIRNGKYCTYRGKEFKANYDTFKNLLIFAEDSSYSKEGFIDEYGVGVYSKAVEPSEVSNCYRVTTQGIIKGLKVDVFNEREEEYLVGTAYSDIAEKLGLIRTDKYYHDKWVNKSEVDVFEEVEAFEFI